MNIMFGVPVAREGGGVGSNINQDPSGFKSNWFHVYISWFLWGCLILECYVNSCKWFGNFLKDLNLHRLFVTLSRFSLFIDQVETCWFESNTL